MAPAGEVTASAGGVWVRRRAGVVLAGVVVACSVSACAGPDQQGTLKQRVSAWTSSAQFAEAVGTLYGDAQHVDQVVRLGRGTNAIHTACAVLLSDTDAAEEYLPSPDLTMTDALNTAVTLDFDAGTDCFNGAGKNAALMRTSAQLRARADTALKVAVSRADQILGTTVATTTTTTPDDGGL
jgi:hypothetical protein